MITIVERKVYDPIQIKVMDREEILEVTEVPDGVVFPIWDS